ncbi:hypothetical protein FQR65_LT14344 [Abscondita terminalis]|nr:hypothetical protein FQR65_LT14344 [Abscondita terminalis]
MNPDLVNLIESTINKSLSSLLVDFKNEITKMFQAELLSLNTTVCALQEKCTKLEQEVISLKSCNTTGNLEDTVNEINERNIRANNVMLFNVTESKHESVESRMEFDKKVCSDIISEIGFSTYPSQVIRVGDLLSIF